MSAADIKRRNRERAAAARAALAAYCHCTTANEDPEGMTDLLVDCGHLANEYGEDFVGLVQRALRHWTAERRHPDGLEAATSVPHFEIVRTSTPRSRRGRRRA